MQNWRDGGSASIGSLPGAPGRASRVSTPGAWGYLARQKMTLYEPDYMHEALCLYPFQYAPYRRLGEEMRAQRLIPHLPREFPHNRRRLGKRLVLLLSLPT